MGGVALLAFSWLWLLDAVRLLGEVGGLGCGAARGEQAPRRSLPWALACVQVPARPCSRMNDPVLPPPPPRTLLRLRAADATAGLQALVKEHSGWLASNCGRQLANYRAFAEARAAALGRSLDSVLATELEGLDSDAEARRRWRAQRAAAAEAAADAGGGSSGSAAPDAEAALVAVSKLDPKTTGEAGGAWCGCPAGCGAAVGRPAQLRLPSSHQPLCPRLTITHPPWHPQR